MTGPLLSIRGLAKHFVMHTLDGVRLPVLASLDLDVHAGECVVLHGPSGAGKSTLLRMVYGNYRADEGNIFVRHRNAVLDIAGAGPRDILGLRRETMAYVS